jgi:hypothetical protein
MSIQTMTTIEVEANAATILRELQQKAAVQGRSLAALLQPLAEATPADPLDSLRESFELRDEARLKRYLQQYDFLLPILHEARTQIARFFPDSPRLALEAVWDPSDASTQLYVMVPTRLSAQEAYEQMDKLAEEWWYEACERAQFRMNIVEELI